MGKISFVFSVLVLFAPAFGGRTTSVRDRVHGIKVKTPALGFLPDTVVKPQARYARPSKIFDVEEVGSEDVPEDENSAALAQIQSDRAIVQIKHFEFQQALEQLRSKKEEEYLEAEKALENAAEFHRVALLTSSAKLNAKRPRQSPNRKMANLLANYKQRSLGHNLTANLLATKTIEVKKCLLECRKAILATFRDAESLDSEIENLCLPRCKWHSSYLQLRDDKCCDQAFFPWLEEQLENGN